MKMLTSGIFWGIIVILIGLTIILKAVFGINIPLFRIILGVIVIYFGIRIIAGGFTSSLKHEGVFSGDTHIEYSKERHDYSIIFGKGTIDLSRIKEDSFHNKLEANIIFSDGVIIVPRNYPLKVELSAVFGQTTLDDKRISGIGSSTWYSPEYESGEKHAVVKASAIFGNAEIRSR